MTASRPIIAFTVVCVLAGASSRAFAQSGMAGMDHSKHRMGPEIVIPKGALYTKADVEFMQGMIAHHAQAIVMSRMAEAHGANPQVLKLSRKIDQSQVPEIRIMQEWLRRQRAVRAGHVVVARHADGRHAHRRPAQGARARRRALSSTALFLACMIQHHAGALKMVDDLFKSPGAGQEVDVNVFANDVVTAQTAEIGIMQTLAVAAPRQSESPHVPYHPE